MITLITMENILSPFFSLAAFFGFLLFHGILKWFIRIQAASCASLQSCLCLQYSPYGTLVFVEPISEVDKKVLTINSDLSSAEDEEEEEAGDHNITLKSGDVEMVMKRLGIFSNPISDQKLNERFSSDDFSSLFDENEPSFEEVKEAFDVFDENKDGFIDAAELQNILCCLGLKEGLNLKECERMIRVYDENSDGKIDFNEFVKFMEKSL